MNTGFIDWTDTQLHIYTFAKEGKGYTLSDTRSFDIEGMPTEDILSSIPTTGMGNIHLSLPLSVLTLREQSFPFSDSAKIKETLAYELEGVLLKSPSEFAIDHIEMSSSEDMSNVLAVCLEKDRLHEFIDLFALSGLDPKVVTSVDLALSEGHADRLLDLHISDTAVRAEAAGKELLKPSINLRQNELAYTGDIDKFRKSFRTTAVLVLLLLLILAGNSFLKLNTLRQEHDTLAAQMMQIYKSVFPEDRRIVDVKRQFKGNINTLKTKNRILAGMPVLDILLDIADDNNNSGIKLYEFNADSKNIIIKGTASSFEEVDSFRNRLSAKFTAPKITDSGTDADKKVGFTMIMQARTS